MRGIARKASRAFFEAGGFVDEKTKGNDLYVSEQGVLFDNAKIEFFPNLQLHTHAVKAGHAASVKKYREEDLFYLMSRGLNEEEAKTLLLEGFLDPFLKMINVQEVLTHA